jgi:HEAT repeat protein
VQALGWLAKSDDQKAMALITLLSVLKDGNSRVRRNAAEAMAKLGTTAARNALGEALRNEQDVAVTRVIKEALGMDGSK